MTHKDILTKFMIEYDKANITSSYPSLTEYEIATILDKAYLALIAQKFTGNNQRKVLFEYDSKAIEDLLPIIITEPASYYGAEQSCDNDITYNVPSEMLFFISAKYDKSNVLLVNHTIADKYKVTDVNYPWIKQPVCYIEGGAIHVLVDPKKVKYNTLDVTYVYKPLKFVKDNISDMFLQTSYFELSDNMAEELINLAITFALETVESTRLNSKTSLLSLES